MLKMLASIMDWVEHVFEPKGEFGLTFEEEDRLIELAKRGPYGYDCAMELAISGYDMTFKKFDAFLAEHNIARQ